MELSYSYDATDANPYYCYIYPNDDELGVIGYHFLDSLELDVKNKIFIHYHETPNAETQGGGIDFASLKKLHGELSVDFFSIKETSYEFVYCAAEGHIYADTIEILQYLVEQVKQAFYKAMDGVKFRVVVDEKGIENN